MIFKLIHYQSLTPSLVRIFLAPQDKLLNYQAGQYLEILYPDNTFQPFSIANAPKKEGWIELHLRHLPNDQPTVDMLKRLQEKKMYSDMLIEEK